jgi:PGAP1-like protein.
MQMINTLKNNPEIREKYQFWFFTYSSGNPLLYSASRLRESIQNARRELAVTPEQQAVFDNMVILGHSMGGLISKTTIMDPDNLILKKLTGLQWSDIERKCSREQKNLVNDLLIFNSVPSVRRIVFLAVPHRGSPMAKSGSRIWVPA